MKKTVAAVFAMVLSWSCESEAATIVGFTGPYAPENWTTNWSGGKLGEPYFTAEKLTLFHSGSGNAWISVTIVETGTITFEWSVTDTWSSMEGSLLASGVAERIRSEDGTETQTLNVVAGQTMTFYLTGVYLGASGRLNVSNFKAESVPEPSTFGGVVTGLVAALAFRRQRR